MKILLLDNYDSFTWNLYDYLVRCGAIVQVKRNDAITIHEIEQAGFDGIVLSPGPGRPADAGIMMSVIDHFHQTLPVLGICLGYQALGAYFGAEVVHSPVPMHGKTSVIAHEGTGLFQQVPNPTTVMRYHSLNIASIPDIIRISAQTTDTGEPMALVHRNLPLVGVQFHPESVLSPDGITMIGNWLKSLH